MSSEQPAALKEIFDRARMRFLADETHAIWPPFDAERFFALATAGLDDLGIMQRMRLAAEAFHATLPDDDAKALAILDELAPRIRHGFASITLCEFVLLRGDRDVDRSMAALKTFTRYGSAEFAIRPFIERDPQRVLAVMRGWAEDDNEHVRRLASEGARPRLPWSFQLRDIVADPSLTWPILDRLRADPSLYVRKSVANHLNDIGKDHPDWLLEKLAGWPRDDVRTAWIVKHALRTLIKKGDARALALIGASGEAEVSVGAFAVAPASLALGERLTISATLVSTSTKPQRLVVDYAIHYVKKNGAASRKVFKLKAFDLAPGASETLSISQTVRDFTTRTHHPGFHKVELMANGATIAEGGFELVR
jgi:3-methyladenine DNA glycosylase AlkC